MWKSTYGSGSTGNCLPGILDFQCCKGLQLNFSLPFRTLIYFYENPPPRTAAWKKVSSRIFENELYCLHVKDGKKLNFFAIPLLPLRFITFVSILNFVGSSEEDGGKRRESERGLDFFSEREETFEGKTGRRGEAKAFIRAGRGTHQKEGKKKKLFFLSGEGRRPY